MSRTLMLTCEICGDEWCSRECPECEEKRTKSFDPNAREPMPTGEGNSEPTEAILGTVGHTVRMRIDCPCCDSTTYVVAIFTHDRSCGRPAATCGPSGLYKDPPYDRVKELEKPFGGAAREPYIEHPRNRAAPGTYAKRIKITQCTAKHPTKQPGWYANFIGEELEVKYMLPFGYQTVAGFVLSEDCEVLEWGR